MNRKELEDRLINFAVSIVKLIQELPESKTTNYFAGQLLRSGSSPALNYGEAQAGESRKDFIHKMKIALKELRETHVCLSIIYRSKLLVKEENIESVMKENNELISIFVKSVETAQKNDQGQDSKLSKIQNHGL